MNLQIVDGGENWQHVGVGGHAHIGRILIDPRNPDVVWLRRWVTVQDRTKSEAFFARRMAGGRGKKFWSKDNVTAAIDLCLSRAIPARGGTRRCGTGFGKPGQKKEVVRAGEGLLQINR